MLTWGDIEQQENGETRSNTCGECQKEFVPDGENEKFCHKCNARHYVQVDSDEHDGPCPYHEMDCMNY